ncbi:MAG: nucleotidyltransferase substrate binding protein [Legionellales bacterium]
MFEIASIQRFEYRYELAHKMLKRYLELSEPNAEAIEQMSFSDLDLAIDAKKALTYPTLVSLKNDFKESDLPYKVDVIDWYLMNPPFQKSIEDFRHTKKLYF